MRLTTLVLVSVSLVLVAVLQDLVSLSYGLSNIPAVYVSRFQAAR